MKMVLYSCFRKVSVLILWCFFLPNIASSQLSWQLQNSGSSDVIKDLFFIDDNTGWAVGTNGLVIHTTNGGALWEPMDIGTVTTLHEVFFVNDQIGWIVGEGSVIFKTLSGGTTWFVQSSGLTNILEGIFFISPLVGWASGFDGSYGKFFKTTDGGDTWAQITVDAVTSGLWKIQFLDENVGWVVGTLGIYKTIDGGANWVFQGQPGGAQIEAISMVDANTGWVCGSGGTIATTTDGGLNWNDVATLATADLWDIRFIDLNHGIATGINGQVLYTLDGGIDWTLAGDGMTGSNSFYALEATNIYTVYVAGENGYIFKSVPAANDLIVQAYHGLDTLCAGLKVPVVITITNIGSGPIQDADFVLMNGATPILYYHWSGFLPGGSSQDINLGETSLDYSGTVECIISGDSITANNISDKYIEITPNPASTSGEHEICKGDSVEIAAYGGFDYYWFNATSDTTNPVQVVKPEISTDYFVLVKADICNFPDSVSVIVEPCTEPITAFSPNNDGVNDFLQIDLVDGKENILRIYNRWGDLVNSYTNYDNVEVFWDGTDQYGNSLIEGTYYFTFETSDGTVAISNWVQIVR